jgi:predicted GNAT family acetyltransferase
MEVIHDKKQQKFYTLHEGKESYTLYRSADSSIMNFYRTYVPPEQRNRGLASKVVRAALQYAEENNLRVTPSCSYVEYFIMKHKEYQKLLV